MENHKVITNVYYEKQRSETQVSLSVLLERILTYQ